MKLLVATGIFPPQIGGPATYSKLLYDELPKRGIEVEVVSFGDFIDKPKLIRHFLYFREVLRKLSDVDAVLALDPVSVGLPVLFASQIRGKKMILRVAGDYAWEQGVQRYGVKENLDHFVSRGVKYPWQVKVLKRIQTYVAEGATAIITPSKYLKSILVDWGIDSRKVSVIYNGFNVIPIKETPSALRRELKWDTSTAKAKVIISVGRLVPWKGMRALIDAMPAVIAVEPTARLVIVGDGPEESNLKQRASELGLNEPVGHVMFAGRLDQKKLFAYVKAADVFVLNTQYEGFSHQILETMSLGTAVITTPVGGNVELIEDAKTGLFVPYNGVSELSAAIVRLLSDSALSDSLVKHARVKVGEFTDEKMLSKLTEFLTQQCGS